LRLKGVRIKGPQWGTTPRPPKGANKGKKAWVNMQRLVLGSVREEKTHGITAVNVMTWSDLVPLGNLIRVRQLLGSGPLLKGGRYT